MKNIIILLCMLCTGFAACAQKFTTAITLGPMIHFNIAEKKMKPSIAVEGAFWLFPSKGSLPPPISLDLGLEWEKKKIRMYSEFQTGYVFFGASVGPVYEFNLQSKEGIWGVQGSAWANIFLGVDARVRLIDNKTIFSPGIYAKAPLKYEFDL